MAELTKAEYTALKEGKPTDPWTDKQLATMRQNCVTIAIEWAKTNPSTLIDLIPFANMLYAYVLKNELPTKENEE